MPKKTFSSLSFTNSFTRLGDQFFSRVKPTPLESNIDLIHFNDSAAELLELDSSERYSNDFLNFVSGKDLPEQSDPLAMLYAGHQFGHYVPQLGDGRAIMLGEVSNSKNHKWEIQLKGSGLTPYSRDGDGRAVLRSTIREYLCSEAMHGLGIPTTRALCMIGSDDEVYRENIETGAILTRLAPTHIRFGSFEVFYYRNQFEQIRSLADFVIEHHYPELLEKKNRYLALLHEVIRRTAHLIAQWQVVGFAHGVMNTDNMSVLGVTMDYGPYGFLDNYDPGFICNHSDYQGRYAFDQQPNIGLFNLSCFAQALLPILDESPQQAAELAKHELSKYQQYYINSYADLMRDKLGLTEKHAEDQSILEKLLTLMKQDNVDYTILFRRLSDFSTSNASSNSSIRDLFIHREKFDQWAREYTARLEKENSVDMVRCRKMKQRNPKYILRNYMAEIAIRKAEDEKDYSEIERLFSLLSRPFDEHPEHEEYAGFPPDWAGKISVSCSS